MEYSKRLLKEYGTRDQEKRRDILKAIPSEMQAEKILSDSGFIVGAQDQEYLTEVFDRYNDIDVVFHDKLRPERNKTYNAGVSVKSHYCDGYHNLFLETFDRQGKPSWAYGGADGSAFFSSFNRFFMDVQDKYNGISFHEITDQIIDINKSCSDNAWEIIKYFAQDQGRLLDHSAILYRYSDIANALARKAIRERKKWNEITSQDKETKVGTRCFKYYWNEDEYKYAVFNDWDQRYGRAIFSYDGGKPMITQANENKPVTFKTIQHSVRNQYGLTDTGSIVLTFTKDQKIEHRERMLTQAEERQKDGLTAEEYFNTLYWEGVDS